MEAHLQLYEMMFSAAKPMALKAAILLNVPQIIATHGRGNPLSVDDIAEITSASITSKAVHKEYLFRILRLLTSWGVFTEETDEQIRQVKYGLNSVSKLLVKDENGDSCTPIIMLAVDKVYMDAHHYIHDAVLERCHPFINVYGMRSRLKDHTLSV